jgi:hypothetical protein
VKGHLEITKDMLDSIQKYIPTNKKKFGMIKRLMDLKVFSPIPTLIL